LPIYRGTLQTFVMLLCGPLWSFAVFSHTGWHHPAGLIVSMNARVNIAGVFRTKRHLPKIMQIGLGILKLHVCSQT